MKQEYGANQIQVLEGLEAVRLRPGMYIGSTGPRGLHHLVYEIVDNSIDEALQGYCDRIYVCINEDGSVTTKDDGRGIPVETHPKTGKSTLETVLTILHAGGKFGGGGYKVSGGLHGVGISVVNGLSEWLVAEVYRNGKIYRQSYKKGITDSELEIVGESDHTGTIIQFMPDATIFDDIVFDYKTLETRLRELAFLNKGVRIVFEDKRPGQEQKKEFLYDGGIREFVEYLNSTKTPIHENVVYIDKKIQDCMVEIAIQYTDGYSENILSFANNIDTHEGGAHLAGFKAALTKTVNEYAKRNKLLKDIYFKPELKQTLDVWDGQLAQYGSKIIERRTNFIEKINEIIKPIHKQLTGGLENINIVYNKNCEAEDLLRRLEENRDRDIKYKSTSIGPHKDDLLFFNDNKNIRIYGSQGQQRTIALSLKLAELELVKNLINDTPVLLLDDVLSELDSERQNHLLNSIDDIQTIITCTGLDEFIENRFKINKVFQVTEGKVEEKTV